MSHVRTILLVCLSVLAQACGPTRTSSDFQVLSEGAASYQATALQLSRDTSDAQLASDLGQMEQERQRLDRSLQQLHAEKNIPKEQANRLHGIHQQLRQLRARQRARILESYSETIVPFVELNRWELTSKGGEILAGTDWSALCEAGKRLLIYGYGDPTGGDQPTRRISVLRAKSVASWIRANSGCSATSMRERGLGVDIKASEIRDAEISSEEREELYRRSRYVRILVSQH